MVSMNRNSKRRQVVGAAQSTATKNTSVTKKKPLPKSAEPPRQSRKHKAVHDEDTEHSSSKKAKTDVSTLKQSQPLAINRAPVTALGVLVFGDGENGELGLGTGVTEAISPRLNSYLHPDTSSQYCVVQISCGGMHTVALTADNKILTWGVNDNFALGRDTRWEGRMKDVDAESDDEGELNPLESTPTAIPADHFPPGTQFAQVAAGDSCSFALTDAGSVYGWGTFRDAKGDECFGYDQDGQRIEKQETPMPIRGLQKIIQIACGANHALALDVKGNIWAWGANDENQLGRRLFGRFQERLIPLQVRVCRGSAKYIACGEYHAFAVDLKDNVWGWGRNSNGEAGQGHKIDPAAPSLPYPMKVPGLSGRGTRMLSGGSNHSAAVTADGQCLLWGRADSGQLGIDFNSEELDDTSSIHKNFRGKPSICLRPIAVKNVGQVASVACGTDHTIFINRAGHAFSTGFGSQGQLRLKTTDDVEVAQQIGGKHVQNRKMSWAGAGGRFSTIGWSVNSCIVHSEIN